MGSNLDLRGLPFPPAELGLNSPHAVVGAFHLLSEYDMTARLVASPLVSGSADKLLAAHALFGDDLEIRIECRVGSVWGVVFPRPRDLEYCQKDMGPLPSRTWTTVCSGACRGEVKWFAAPLDSPNLKVGERLCHTNARLAKSVAVPNTRVRTDRDTLSYERHHWLPNHEPWSCNLAQLPASWLRSLPTLSGPSISATSDRRTEWCGSPRSPRYTG